MRSLMLSFAVLVLAVPLVAAQADSGRPGPADPPTVGELVGTWQLTKMEMMRRSELADLVAQGVQGTVTFGSDGSVAISLEESGATEKARGTYTLNGSSFTMTIENEPASGSVGTDGNSLILHFTAIDDEPVKLDWILTRQ